MENIVKVCSIKGYISRGGAFCVIYELKVDTLERIFDLKVDTLERIFDLKVDTLK